MLFLKNLWFRTKLVLGGYLILFSPPVLVFDEKIEVNNLQFRSFEVSTKRISAPSYMKKIKFKHLMIFMKGTNKILTNFKKVSWLGFEFLKTMVMIQSRLFESLKTMVIYSKPFLVTDMDLVSILIPAHVFIYFTLPNNSNKATMVLHGRVFELKARRAGPLHWVHGGHVGQN